MRGFFMPKIAYFSPKFRTDARDRFSLFVDSDLTFLLGLCALAILILAVVNAISGLFSKRIFDMGKDLRVSLFALILCHLQLLIGLILYFISPSGLSAIQEFGMGGLTSAARLLAVNILL